jgi:hypothetical protein
MERSSMEIISVEYRRLISLPEYENVSVGGTARVEIGETADQALSKLSAWVESKISLHVAEQDEKREVAQKGRELMEIERRVGEAEKRWNKAKTFLERLGLKLPREYYDPSHDDELPF